MRMVLLATYFLVALAVAEATPQVFGDGEIINKGPFVHEFEAANAPITQSQFVFDKNSGSYFTVWETITPTQVVQVTPVTQSQFGHIVNIREPIRNVAPISNSGNIIQTVAPVPAAPAPTFTQFQDHPISHPLQPLNSCDSGCKCTEKGGLCIPAGQNCANSDSDPVDKEGYCKPLPASVKCKCCNKPTVYKQDIENTVVFFLQHLALYNIDGSLRTLNQTVQRVLSNTIETFHQHLPLEPSFKRFLNCLRILLLTLKGRSVTGDVLWQFYVRCDNDKSRQHLPTVREWVGCKNYKNPGWEKFRSYPCGVWTTFHTITVHILLHPPPHKAAKSILQTLHDFVNYFPWCNMCKHDFLSMYKNLHGAKVNTAKDVVMWLWKGHNRVTARTATSFAGPKDKIWEQCSQIGETHIWKSLLECKLLCKLEQSCTAINYFGFVTGQCQLRACRYPAPTPDTLKSGWQGYAIATGDGSDQGRSHWQFPGKHQCPGCQSSTPPGLPSTGCGYPQIHQVDGCFDRKAVLVHLKTMYKTFY